MGKKAEKGKTTTALCPPMPSTKPQQHCAHMQCPTHALSIVALVPQRCGFGTQHCGVESQNQPEKGEKRGKRGEECGDGSR